MLDSNLYYAAFPDENPKNKSLDAVLLATLEKLNEEFRKYLEQSEPSEPTKPGPVGRR
jgi:hypothetical protein